MKSTFIAAAALIFSGSFVFAQNASTGSTVTTGDSAISPANPNQSGVTSNESNRPSPGSGVNSGILNNGRTGDTIGTEIGPAPIPARRP